jgi:PPP family 3-phenylpropionic acid transporter
MRRLLMSPPFLLMILAAGLTHAGHAVQFGFGSLRWAEAGYPSWLIGLLWAEASAAEILLFAYGGRLVERLGPSWLLAIAGALGAARWLVLGATTELWAVVPVQLFHAANFGAMHLGAMLFIARAVAPGYANMAQSLYSGLTFGAMMGGAMLFTGWLYALSPFTAYGAAAAMSAGGAAVALALGLAWRGRLIGAAVR